MKRKIYFLKTVILCLLFLTVTVYANQTTADSGTYQAQSGGAFYLSFPLPNRTPYTAIINSVFDHSMTSAYTADQVVVAYTGETGSVRDNSVTPSIINGVSLYSYKKPDGTVFVVNGNYGGAGTPATLNYDGHSGIDFRTTDQDPNGRVNVLAAADGVLHWIPSSAYNTIYIDHGNGYTTHYLHLFSRTANLDGTPVTRGQVIGISGDTGSSGSPHLHFEVRLNDVPVDPYGWEGCSGCDPYVAATNVNLWSSGTQITDPDITALANTTQPIYWFYIAINNFSKWYIVETNSSPNPAVMLLNSVDPNVSGGIRWKPISNYPAYAGFPAAGINFSSVAASSDGRSITFGGLSASQTDPDITALANTTQPVYWFYIAINNFSKWYIVETNSSPNPAVMLLNSVDPNVSGGIRWKPISNYPAYAGFPAAGINFSSVAASSDGRSITFGGLSH